jgi:hypothetical protein
MDLIATIFLLVLFTEFVSWIGSSVLLDLVRRARVLRARAPSDRLVQTYGLYKRIFYRTASARQRALKVDVLRMKQELLQTSAQDQFAKWARLRRTVDKGLAELEKLSACFSPHPHFFHSPPALY